MNESHPYVLPRKDRLIEIIGCLRDGMIHRGEDLAQRFNVSPRTIYRDMGTLRYSGVPLRGNQGVGYQMTAAVTLPPLNLTMEELEALHLGLAVMTEADDPGLQEAAKSLANKLDTALPEGRVANSTGWGLAVFPFADTRAGIHHMPLLRDALRHNEKLRLSYRELDNTLFETVILPLGLEYWGRVWRLYAQCDSSGAQLELRVERIEILMELSVMSQTSAP